MGADECVARLEQHSAPSAAGSASALSDAALTAVRRGMQLFARYGHMPLGHTKQRPQTRRLHGLRTLGASSM
jgi:hypothetical protein